MDNESLATELLHEVKAQAKRWFIIAMIELAIIVFMITGFLWYISLPTDETTYYKQEAEQSNTEESELTQTIGGNE